MEFVRDTETNQLILVDGDKKLFSLGFFYDEFLWSFYTSDSILITREVDEEFFAGLEKIMAGQYFFGNNGLSSLNNDKLVWLSDQCCDLEDVESTNKVSRLIIEKDNACYRISTYSPFFSKMNINRLETFIAFSPSGNGYYTQNKVTGSTFQDDIIMNLFRKKFADKVGKHFLKKCD